MKTLILLIMATMAVAIGCAWSDSTVTTLNTVAPVAVRQPELLSAEKTLTLSDAVTIALANQPTVRQSAAQIDVETGLATQVQARLRPGTSVAASETIARSGGASGAGSVSLSASQLLFDFNRTRYQLTQQRHNLSSGVFSYSATAGSTVLDIKRDYFDALRTARLVSVFQENVKDQSAHVDEAQARFDAGLAPKSDVLKAQAAAASAKVDLVNAQNASDLARVTMNVNMGIDVRSNPKLVETSEPEAPVPAVDDAVTKALASRPEIMAATEQVLAAQVGVSIARTVDKPAVTATASKGFSIGSSGGVGGDSWAVLLNLQWTPVDVGQKRGAITQSSAQLVQAQESLYAAKQSVTSDVISARLNLLAATESLTSATAEVTSAREDLAASTGRYEAGVGTFLEVLDAQSALLKAEVDEASARYAGSTARAQLTHAVGGDTSQTGR